MKEERTCQNCKLTFSIEPEDFQFYKKIDVPPPTFCPECRFIRRYLWRNERSLYKRKCDVPGHTEEMVSMYASEKGHVVYDDRFWWSDEWDPLNYGVSYDFSIPFFEQYKQFLKKIPLIGLSVTNNVQSAYCNVSAWDKGCYMISASGKNENTLYGNRLAYTKDSCDIYISDKNQNCYECVNCTNCFRVCFSTQSRDCIDSYFLFDCSNCQSCFGCVGLRNKNYYIFNEPYLKEDYDKKIKEMRIEGFSGLKTAKESFKKRLEEFPRKFANLVSCVGTTGDNVKNSKNAKFCFDASGVEDGKFFTWVYATMKDSYDVGAGSGIDDERLYECWDVNQCSDVGFSGVMYSCYHSLYCWNCHGSHNLFGCYGLRNKEYCILNKQYTKEEYESIIPKIKQHMNDMPYIDQKGRVYKYGEFFPPELSPFAYNETIAQEYFPLTKDGALSQGYAWRDPDTKDYKPTKTPQDLPDHIKDIPDSIINEIIQCAHAKQTTDNQQPTIRCNHQCTTAFKIIPEELSFYRRMNPARPDDTSGRSGGLPLPRLCPNCRHYERLQQRNPLKLWHRKCMCNGVQSANGKGQKHENTVTHEHGDNPCPNEFETSYSPDRKEIVYCESCYQAEVV